MTDEIKEIIQRWGCPVFPDNYIFPILINGLTPEQIHNGYTGYSTNHFLCKGSKGYT